MKSLKKIIKNTIIADILCYILYMYLTICFKTTRWQYFNKEILESHNNKAAIYLFWHSRMMMMPLLWHNNNMHVVISHHRDGRLISKVMEFFKLHTVSGSTSKGGVKAAQQIIELLKIGHSISITPDGPRGPARKLNSNALKLAQIANVPIIGVTYDITRKKTLSSWDKMIIPKPFGKGKIAFSILFSPSENNINNDDTTSQEIENKLNAITDLCIIEEN
jgi:lysophospholipid acyltransferase (LPLAT)-like uncharacterized protein